MGPREAALAWWFMALCNYLVRFLMMTYSLCMVVQEAYAIRPWGWWAANVVIWGVALAFGFWGDLRTARNLGRRHA